MYKIYIGSLDDPLYYFEQPDTFGAVSTQRVNLVGQELSIDTFEPVVMDGADTRKEVSVFLSSDGKRIITADGQVYALSVRETDEPSGLISLEYGTPVWYYYEQTLIGKFYYKSTDRAGENKYKLHCMSMVGLLDKMDHGGGLFLSATFGEVLDSIMIVPGKE